MGGAKTSGLKLSQFNFKSKESQPVAIPVRRERSEAYGTTVEIRSA
jgi:hypothetical protein